MATNNIGNNSNDLVRNMSKSLKTGRLSTKGIIAIVLFGAIILVFVLSGLMKDPSMGSGGFAARVNNNLISMADLGSQVAQLEQMYAPLFGGQVSGDAQRQFLRQQALENLIVQELVAQSATKEGIMVTDAEIQDTVVREIPAFQKDGRFQKELYFQLLEANRLTPGEFEDKLRKDKKNARVRRLFEVAAMPTNYEMAKLQTLKDLKMNVAFASFDKDAVIANMKTGDAKAELAKPEFSKQVEEYYNTNKIEFASEEQVRAQHILIKIDEQTTAGKALEIVTGIKNRLAKEDFAKVAKETSQDTGSKANGGDLGYFGKGKMVPEFETAAFGQKVGTLSEPIKSSFGYHLIKVLDHKAAEQKPLEQVRENIANKLLASNVYETELKNIEDALQKNDLPAVEAGLKKMGATWQETGFFEMSTDRVPKLESPEVSKAAFAVSEKTPLYPALVRDGSQKFVLRYKDSKTEKSAVAGTVANNLSQERAADMFGAWIESAKKSALIERNEAAIAR